MKESLRKLACLDDDLPVYPGHGPTTSIGFWYKKVELLK